MAEKNLNTGQGEPITMDEAVTHADPDPDKETPTALDLEGSAQPEAGDVVVDAAKIDEAEIAVPGEEDKEPESPNPGTEEKVPETTTSEADTRPESEKAPWERPLADLEAEQKAARRGRPSKSKEGLEAGKGGQGQEGSPGQGQGTARQSIPK